MLIGHAKRLVLEPWGSPQVDWDATMPSGLYRTFIGPVTILMPNSAAALAAIFGKTSVCQKPLTIRKGLSTIIGNGLITSEGEAHKNQRKLLNPIFRNVRTMVPNFWSKALRIRNEIREDLAKTGPGSSDVFDVSSLTQKVTFSMIMSTTFGFNIEEEPQKETDLLMAWKAATLHGQKQNLLETFLEGVLPYFIPPQYTSWALDHTPRNRRSIRGRKEIERFSRDQIRAFKAASKTPDDVANTTKTPSLLAWMVQSGMTDEEDLVNHLKTFLSAGHETTASTLDWALYSLATHPKMQSKLREEVLTSTSTMTGDMTADIMDSMPYLHGFVMEVLRLYPSVLVTLREPSKDTVIEDTMIPKGTTMIISPWSINRSRRIWGDDAEMIVPERWPSMSTTPGASAAYSFMTFVHGSRVCIGKEYSIRSIKAVLIAVLLSFRVHEAVVGKKFLLQKSVSSMIQGPMDLRLELID